MASEHIIKSYDEELQRLDNAITQMGGLAESQLGAAIEAVGKRDSDIATEVIEGDVQVDNLEREIESLVVRLLALRQPGRVEAPTPRRIAPSGDADAEVRACRTGSHDRSAAPDEGAAQRRAGRA